MTGFPIRLAVCMTLLVLLPMLCWLLQDLLVETHAHLARKQAQDGNFREAEKHFVEARDWQGALQMYQGAELWDAALRMAKQYGGAQAVAQVRLWGAVKAAAAAWKGLDKWGGLQAVACGLQGVVKYGAGCGNCMEGPDIRTGPQTAA